MFTYTKPNQIAEYRLNQYIPNILQLLTLILVCCSIIIPPGSGVYNFQKIGSSNFQKLYPHTPSEN